MKLQWLPTARKQRAGQIEYIAQDSVQAAIDVGDRLIEQVQQLIQFPELGRPGRRRGTRELVVSRTSLVVVYRVRPRLRRVEILRVLHAAQLWPSAKIQK